MEMLTLRSYLDLIGLPDAPLNQGGSLQKQFLKKGCHSYRDAIVYVKKLTYGRTSDRGNYQQVLKEKRGTCSGKHALLAALARELSIPHQLVLGIFLLDKQNMPQIHAILEKYDLPAIPEAHSFLEFSGKTLDVTFPDSQEYDFLVPLEQRITILPEAIGEHKVTLHQSFINQWAKNRDLDASLVWSAREEWIHSLS